MSLVVVLISNTGAVANEHPQSSWRQRLDTSSKRVR